MEKIGNRPAGQRREGCIGTKAPNGCEWNSDVLTCANRLRKRIVFASNVTDHMLVRADRDDNY